MGPVIAGKMMCAVCGISLHVGGLNGQERGYLHPMDLVDPDNRDHIPIPIPYDAAKVVVLCDFCNNPTKPEARYTVPAETFKLGSDSYVGAWCACPTCAGFVREDDWSGLLERSVRLRTSQPLEVVVFGMLFTGLHDALRKHILGPVRFWRPGDEQGTGS